MLIEYFLLVVVVTALVAVIYSGLGGRALFGTREVPGSILGQTVQFCEYECNGAFHSQLPLAIVTSYDAPDYRLDLTKPFIFNGREERFVHVRCRHRGYPISSAAKLPVWATAKLESGSSFVTKIVMG